MQKIKDEFELLFADQYCPICDCPLSWGWEEDEMAFVATCDCLKRYSLIPTEATLVFAEPDENPEDADNDSGWT